MALLVTLALGITIGSIVSDGVMSAEQKTEVAELKVQGGGDPVVLDEEVSLREGFARVAQTVEPAVVNISTQSIIQRSSQAGPHQTERFREFFGDDFWERFFGGPEGGPARRKSTSLGSGVTVDSAGYILSNYHVIAPNQERGGNRRFADKIEVQLYNGETYMAEVVGVDPESDLAVLKIDAGRELPFAKVGDSTKLSVGDWVLAIGSPFGLEQTVTAGIVSATKRVMPTGIFGDYIQTDAAINPGNSGGPLVTMNGEVVGINSFITTTSGSFAGVGFAIPSSVFVNSYNQLVSSGKIERGWLGVSMNLSIFSMTDEMAEYFGVAGDDPEGIKDGDGVIVTQLIDESGEEADDGPAAVAGIQVGDVIVKFGDRLVGDSNDLRSAVAIMPPGKTVPVTVVRNGESIAVDVTLAERTLEQQQRAENEGYSFEEEEEERPPKEIGLEFQNLSRRDANELGLEDEQGVVILSVVPGSLADDAGLTSRMVITHVNGQEVDSAQAFKDAVTKVPSGQGVVVRVVAVAGGRKTVGFTSFVKP
jgi:serine protease Do